MIGSIKGPRRLTSGQTRWDFVWDDPAPSGGRKQRSKTFRTKREAEKYQVKISNDIYEGAYCAPTKMTLGEFVDLWVDQVESSYDYPTFISYAGIARNHIRRLLGGRQIAKLSAIDVQQAYRQFRQEGAAPATVRLRHVVLHKMLDSAVALQLIPRNVADAVKPPAPDAEEPAAWSADQVRAFLAATADDRRWVIWRLGFDTGMRISELLALGWSDVDLDKGVLHVRRRLCRRPGGWEIKDGGKSKAARRAIVLLRETVTALRAHRARQNEERLLLGPAWHDLDLVFTKPDGDRESPDTVRDALERAVKRAGLPKLTPHGMRHTMATLLAAADVHPKKVQDRMGHSSPMMAMERYSHVSASMQRDTAERLAEALDGGPTPSVRSA
jgi:integrase